MLHEMFSWFLVAIVVLHEAESYKYNTDKCPKITPTVIDPQRYAGVWYDFSHDSDEIYLCSIFNYTITVEDDQLMLTQLAKALLTNNTTLTVTLYWRILKTTDGEYGTTTKDGKPLLNYLIVDTDYDSYSSEFACTEEGNETFSFMTRKNELTEDLEKKRDQIMEANGIKVKLIGDKERCKDFKF